MSDYISRDVAMAFPLGYDHYDKEHGNEHFIYGVETYREWIESVPAANVVTWEQLKKAWAIATATDVAPVVHGRWIEDGYSHYNAVCSECGEPCETYVMNNPRDRFCKWCGAKMDGGDTVE